MIIGGDYTHHFQIGPQSPGQVMQKAIESGSQANDSFTAQASGNAVHNQQQVVNTLRSAVSRGQAINMFV